jgi:hypothetical protein
MLQFNILASFVNNDNDALVPELWARESIAVLEENMVMGQLVHRDFSMEVASFGDVVNTRKPVDGTIDRKTDADTITYEDAVLNNVQVPLNQHMYAAFVIKDGERSKSLQDLIAIHLVTRMKAMGNGVDRAIIGRMAHALLGSPEDRVGKLLDLDKTNAYDRVLEARERLNRNLAWVSGRNLVLAPGSETAMLQTELFVKANERGDGGTALEEARLGRIGGFDTFMDQNVNGVLSNSDRDTTLATANGAQVAGEAGALPVTHASYTITQGEFVIFTDNGQPTWAQSVTGAAPSTDVTLNEALKYDVANASEVVYYGTAAAGGTPAASYAAGHSGYINIDGFTANKPPVVGQLLAFGNTIGTRHTYSVISVRPVGASEVQVLLDRPLDVAVNNNDAAFPGPAGDFNAAFHRNSFALVTRPLARPEEGTGARSFVAAHNDIAMRATMQYDIDAQGTKVVIDLLAGTAVLDSKLASLLLG